MAAGAKVDRAFVAALLVLLGLGAFVATQAAVTTDMTRFLPTGEAREQAALMKEFATSELSRTMLLLVDAPDEATAVAGSKALEAALIEEPAVGRNMAFLEAGPPQGIDRAFWELYHPRRLSFLARSAEEARQRLTSEALTRSAESLLDRLAMPLSPLITRAAPSDPLMITASMFDRLQPTRAAALKISDGRFVTADGKAAVLFLGTTASAFDASVQKPVLAGVQAAFERANAKTDGKLRLRMAGVNRIAVAAETSIKGDIQRVSIATVVSVIVLFMLLFGSLRLVAVTMVPIAAGMLAGTAGCLVVFGSLHGLTLAFGAALIGVCIDYVTHTYCHHQLEPSETDGARGSVRKVWSGLALGATTTITGFVALGGATFPGLREVSVFGALGVAAALGATRWLVPPLIGAGGAAPPRLRALTDLLHRALELGRRRKVLLWLLPFACASVVAVGLPRLEWNDDLSEFGRVEGPLMEEDAEVRKAIAPFEQRRFVVAVGDDDEAALVANDVIYARLDEAQKAGEIEAFRSIAPLLPSKAAQDAVGQVVTSDKGLWDRLATAFASKNVNAAALEPFKKALSEPLPAALTFDDLVKSPAAPLVRPFRLTLGERVGFVTFLQGVQKPDALDARMAGVEGATVLDFGAVITTAYSGYRQRMIELLLLGLAAVVVLLLVRYRSVRLTVAALVPSLLAAATTLSVLSLAGLQLSVLTITSLLMVVCIGVDYGVFLAETALGKVQLGPTLTALVVAAVSTLLGFGLLSLSDHPALMSLGLTAGVGVGTSVLLAPTALVLVGRSEGSR